MKFKSLPQSKSVSIRKTEGSIKLENKYAGWEITN